MLRTERIRSSSEEVPIQRRSESPGSDDLTSSGECSVVHASLRRGTLHRNHANYEVYRGVCDWTDSQFHGCSAVSQCGNRRIIVSIDSIINFCRKRKMIKSNSTTLTGRTEYNVPAEGETEEEISSDMSQMFEFDWIVS